MTKVVDPKRRAKLVELPTEAFFALFKSGELNGGECVVQLALSGEARSYLFACPGCRRPGTVSFGVVSGWRVESGDALHPEGVTLSPSILHDDSAHGGQCGWHGYLRNGVFEPC